MICKANAFQKIYQAQNKNVRSHKEVAAVKLDSYEITGDLTQLLLFNPEKNACWESLSPKTVCLPLDKQLQEVETADKHLAS